MPTLEGNNNYGYLCRRIEDNIAFINHIIKALKGYIHPIHKELLINQLERLTEEKKANIKIKAGKETYPGLHIRS